VQIDESVVDRIKKGGTLKYPGTGEQHPSSLNLPLPSPIVWGRTSNGFLAHVSNALYFLLTSTLYY
jgi:hypothetical protein